MSTLHAELGRLCAAHDVLALYLFGSRADEGLALLEGRHVPAESSDLDIGVVFRTPDLDHHRLASLQVALEDHFAPLRIDLVPLQRVDALFQFAAIDGHRVATSDSTAADLYELEVMRRGAELLPLERQLQAQITEQTKQRS
jgi:predicted nucleotidyltransferase